MFAISLPRTTRHRRLICWLLLTGLLAAGAGVPASAQQGSAIETDETQRYVWMNGGIGAGRSGLGISFSGGIPFGERAFSGARYLKMGKILSSEKTWEAGPLIGLSKQGRYGHLSVGSGLSVVGGYRPNEQDDKLPTVGVPLDVQLFFTPARNFGIGLHGYANVNREEILLGLTLQLQIRAIP